MSRQRIYSDTLARDRIHHQKVLAKRHRIQSLLALLEMWENHPNPDPAYIAHLHRKLYRTRVQYYAMQP
jgi:hypothetical protein